MREVPGSIPSQGPRYTKDVKKLYQGFLCLTLNIKRETLALSKFSKFSFNIVETNKNKQDIYMFKISVYSNFILYI